MVYFLTLAPLLSLITLTGASNSPIPCTTVPDNGAVTLDSEGTLTFECHSQYELVGVQQARCVNDILDIRKLPVCVLKKPATTHVKSRYFNVVCNEEEIVKRKEVLTGILSAVECLQSGDCTFNEFKHRCPGLNEIEIEAIFTVTGREASSSIKNFMSESHSRRKRDTDFDNLDPDTTDVSDCSDGEGLSADGDTCVTCQAGFYSLDDTCTECAVGTYQNDTGQTSCDDCSGTLSTISTASDEESDCVDACTLPSSSVDSVFTVDNVEQADGSNLTPGTSVTLLCDTDYTYQGYTSVVLDCTDSSTTVHNECYKVIVSPTGDVYKWSNETVEFTCSVNSEIGVDSFTLNNDGSDSGATAAAAETDDTTVSQTFTVTNDTGDGTYSCDALIESSNTDPESSGDSTDVAFVTFSITPEDTVNAGDAFTITAQLTYNSDLTSTEFTWTLDDEELLTNIDTSYDDDYFYSKIQISSVSLDDSGLYKCTTTVKDLSGTQQLESTLPMQLNVKGFTIQPGDEYTSASTTLQENEELLLTCAVSGSDVSAEDVEWYLGSTEVTFTDSAVGSIVNTLSGKITTSILTVSSISSSDTGLYSCMVDTLQSDTVTVATTDYTIVMGSTARCGEAGEDQEITCTASYPSSLSTAPTISWYQVGTSVDSVLSDGDNYVISSSQSGTDYNSVLTLKDVAAGDTYDGSYYCIAVYTDPSYISITATDQTTFTVVGLNEMATQYALIGDTGVTFSTSFYGEAPLDAAWEYNSNEVDSSIASVDTSSGSGASFSLALGTIALDTIPSYDAKVELDSCANDVSETLTATATLEILSVNISSNAEYVFEGDAITIDCAFANPSSLSSSPTVTWTVGGSAYTGSDVDDSATNSNPTGSESLTISSATESDAATYACVVAYTQGTVTEEEAVTVLGGELMDALYLLAGEDDTFTCTFFGGDGTVTWTKSGEEDTTDLSSMVTTDAYSGGQLESRLALTNVSTDDEGEYNCEISFTDYSETKKTTARLYIMSVTVTGDSVINLGDDATLTCDEGDHTGSYSWSKDGETMSAETSATLSLTTATFDTAGDYVCTVVYDDNIGTVSSDDYNLFVEDFVSLAQIDMTGDYNEVGETVTLSAVLMTSSVPSVFELYDEDTSTQLTITNVPSATETDGTDNEYTVTIEFTAISNSDANDDVTLRLVCTTVDPDIESTVATKIYEPCDLPDVTDIPSLSGGSLSHMEELEDMHCTDSYIVGGTTVSCDDGALTYSPSTVQPSCTGISTNPTSQLASVGDIVTLTCATDELTLDISSVVWSNEDGDVYTDDAPVTSGSTVYTSTYSFTAAEANNAKTYKCSVITTAGDDAVSDNATIYIVGVKSGSMSSPGDYFESDKQGGEFSENANITFEIFDGPGSATLEFSLVLTASEDVLIPDVAFVEGSTVDNVITYTYEVSETYKETGTYTVTVTYDTDLAGDKTFEEDLFVPVYEFCAISDLSAVSSGTWSPSTKVSFMSYATLTCSDGSYIQGEGTTRCGVGTATSQFDVETYPTCQVDTELSCGSLETTNNGDVVYVNSSAGYYSCDSDYSLIGDQETYTCTSDTGDWSIVTAENPYGDAPVCQVVAEPESRYVNVTLVLGVIGGSSCQDDSEVAEVKAMMQATLEQDGILECTGDYLCTLINFECEYDSSALESTVDFTLWQSGALTDASVLTDHVALFVDNIDSVTFEVPHSDRKRATVTYNGKTAAVTTTTTCTAGYVTDGDDCVECPAGYGYYSTECTACAIGSYSTGDSVVACTACAGSLTTRLSGSDSADDCIAADDVCTVSVAQAAAALSPPGGSRVNDDSTITITCNSGYGLEINSSDTVRCDEKPYPTCYETCSLAMYTAAELADRYIHDNLQGTTLVHNEQIKITCQSGYQYSADMPVKTFTCSDGTLPDFGSCVETSGSAVLTTVIVCVIVLAVAIIFLFLFILVQWRKKKNDAYKVSGKRNGKQFIDPIENLTAVEEGEVKMTKVSLKLADADKQAPLMSRPVHISDFSKYYDLLTRNEDKEIKQEFGSFDSFDDNNTCYHGSIPENDSKNRYKNIIPFDHSRVKLYSIEGDDPHSDYINASYIHGYHKPRVFIATQAPLYQTVDDFWRMAWEKKSTMIVNLTKVQENGKVKSIVYWPSVEERTKTYGHVTVTRVDKQESNTFVVYSLEITKQGESGCREVYIFNYVGWPDYDVPTRTSEFVNFIYNIRHLLFIRPPMGSIICHCSAGTGRTGAFVGIMNSLDRLVNKEDLDILGLVGSLRQQRRKMVFTHTQYKFLHRVMLDIINNPNFDVLRQSGFRKKIEVEGVSENPYVNTGSDSDELDGLSDTKV